MTKNVDDFARLANQVEIHAGMVFFEDGNLTPTEQLTLLREALGLIESRGGTHHMVNTVLTIDLAGQPKFEEAS
ncbi:MAG: hypothetical protein H6718_01365 [Polyangiaceae bacterium]|nr:hypothetical protein [Polyangiaceae bacterium]MCB9607735.1 hypothetical protein [Polyangiaceae bacterium]